MEETTQEVATASAPPYAMANGLPRMSFSSLMKFMRSPLHWLHDKEQEDPEETAAMRFGSAFHCLVLEPNKWDERFVMIPDTLPERPSAMTINARYMTPDACCIPDDAPKKPTKATINAKYMTDPKTAADTDKKTQVLKDIKWHEDFEAKNNGKVILTGSEWKKRLEVQDVLKQWDDFYKANEGKTFIKKQDRELMDEMCRAIEQEDDACEMIMNHDGLEKVLEFTDEETGIVIKTIIDIPGKVGKKWRVIDMKTAADASPDSYGWEIIRRKTYMQLAMYIDAMNANGMPVKDEDAHIVAIEKTAPYGISTHDIDPELIKRGRYEYKQELKNVKYWFEQGAPRVSYRFKMVSGRNYVACPENMKV